MSVKRAFTSAKSARSGFTLIELLVVIAIIAILAAILFPVFAQAREKARMAACLSNMKQLAIGMQMYAQDYDETFAYAANYDITPASARPIWPVMIQPYVKSEGIFRCPSASNDAYSTNWNARCYPSIGFSGQMAFGSAPFTPGQEYFPDTVPVSYVQEPARTPFFAETPNADVITEACSAATTKNRSYVFDACVAGSKVNAADPRLSTPLIADVDLVKKLGAPPTSLAAGQLKPVFARHHARGDNSGRTTVLLADGHAKTYSAAQILDQDKGANLLWRFRGCPTP
ncbi:MAG: prepilin-type N-terminal cleavage/methylation domain-containing protein [Fibrella sp.]|nr:prepilin-type N-terminal cleavage/methylation domain-containing protein [Armatimonadota bacterium]